MRLHQKQGKSKISLGGMPPDSQRYTGANDNKNFRVQSTSSNLKQYDSSEHCDGITRLGPDNYIMAEC